MQQTCRVTGIFEQSARIRGPDGGFQPWRGIESRLGVDVPKSRTGEKNGPVRPSSGGVRPASERSFIARPGSSSVGRPPVAFPLTGLSMMAIKDRCKDCRRKNVEDDHVNVRVSLDQSKHGYPLLRWRGFFFPSGEP
jgi:hypothetical protein